MKAVLCLLLAMLALTRAAQVDFTEEMEELNLEDDSDYMSALEIGQKVSQLPIGATNVGALNTYLPESGPYDNPATDITPTKTIPSTPSCTIRGQTIFEIRKMRADAKQIGMSIMYEIQTMEKRKTYIEQMTNYLNDRIRELNKVKRDLAAEMKWVQVSNQRIAELAQKEKLIKLQDVMACIKSEQERLNGEKESKSTSVNSLAAQASAIEASIKGIRQNINRITTTPMPSATGYAAGGAGGDGGAPAGGGGDGGAPPPANFL